MSERELRRREPIFFSFYCPRGREQEARTILKDIKGISVSPDSPAGFVSLVRQTGEADMIDVALITGISFSGIKSVVEHLSKAGVAGYSRDTQVRYCDAERLIVKKTIG